MKRETEPTKDEIGNKIRELRIKKGVSQEELGKILDKSHATISDIERGRRNLTAIELDAIARFFGVNADVFFTKEPFSFTQLWKQVEKEVSKYGVVGSKYGVAGGIIYIEGVLRGLEIAARIYNPKKTKLKGEIK